MESKIPYNRFRGEEYDKGGDVFGEMQNVSIEYLQDSSKNYNLDLIPMAWLYDWARVNGLAGYKDVQDWLTSLKERRERPRPLQIAQKKNAIEYIGCFDRRQKYRLKFKGMLKKCELYDGFCFVGGKRYTLDDEQMSRFRKVYRAFNDDLKKGKSNQEGFHQVSKDGLTVYFRRLPNTNVKYQFISLMPNGDVRHDKMVVTKYYTTFDFLGLEQFDERAWMMRRDIPPIDDDFILLGTDDEYLNKELKYLQNKATKEDMEYLTSIDGYKRYYVKKNPFTLDDVSITKIEREELPYYYCSPRYKIDFTLEGEERLSCFYFKGMDYIDVKIHAKSTGVDITKELQEVIDKMIEELP